MPVHESQPLQDLVGNIPDSGLWKELGAVLDHLIEVLLHVLKDKVEFVVLTNHLPQSDNVGMLQLHQ